MAIQELNTVEIDEVAGALGFNLLGGGINPVNGVVNALVNLAPELIIGGAVAGVLGLVSNPLILLQATDPGGVVAVLTGGNGYLADLGALLGGGL